jgi:hypothetical protein
LETAGKHPNFAASKDINNKKNNNYEDKDFFRSSVNNDGPDDRM